MCQCLQEMILWSNAWIHDPPVVQDRPVNHDITENEKVQFQYFDFTFQLAYKKLPLVEFQCHMKEEYL